MHSSPVDDNQNIPKRPGGMPVGRPFQKGQSGNPEGRPRMKKLRARLREFDNNALGALITDMTGPAGPERSAALKLFFAYRWGLPLKAVELSGPGGSQLTVEVRKFSEKSDETNE